MPALPIIGTSNNGRADDLHVLSVISKIAAGYDDGPMGKTGI